MTDSTDSTDHLGTESSASDSYEPPQLERYGSIEELTGGSTGLNQDGSLGSL